MDSLTSELPSPASRMVLKDLDRALPGALPASSMPVSSLMSHSIRLPGLGGGHRNDLGGAVPLSSQTSTPLRIKQFFAYQIRLPMTGVCLLSGLALALLSPPGIALGSWQNRLLIAGGYLVLLLGVVVRIWSINHIQMRKSVSLVTTGPYSLCRNPLYVGTLMIVTGYLLIVQSVTLASFFIPILLLYHWGVVPAEEQVLQYRHAGEFSAYCRKVPRWLPQLNGSAFRGSTLTWSSAVRREVECGGWWILIAVLVQLVCSCRMASWWVHPLMWP